MKPFPRGAYLLTSGQLDPQNPFHEPPPLAHANCDGMRVKTQWSILQPTSDIASIDFSQIDLAVSIAHNRGKKVGISINAGGFCPDWLWAAGAQSYTLTEGRVAGEKVPVPNDPVFLNKWKKVIAAFGARYDANPDVAYVVICGLGNHDEWNLAQGPNDSAALAANGGVDRWIAQAETIITSYANKFPTTPFMSALQFPFYGQDGADAIIVVSSWAVIRYTGRFGVGNNGLNPNSQIDYPPNQIIHNNYSTQPSGFQEATSLPANHDLLNSMQAAANLGGRYVEIYQVDMANNALQNDITQGRQLLLGV